jgi:outer membrane lipoprotein SlyB
MSGLFTQNITPCLIILFLNFWNLTQLYQLYRFVLYRTTFISTSCWIEALIKALVGGTVGAVVGTIMFKSGGGMRAASVATGLGVAAGSTFQRLYSTTQKEES